MNHTCSNNEENLGMWYMLCSIVLAITMGAFWGIYLLFEIGEAQSFTTISIFDINAHGNAQIFGWVGLFIMAIAYLTIPRFWKTPLAMPALAYITLGCVVSGVVIRAIGMVSSETYGVAMLGSLLLVIAAILFTVQIFSTYKQSKISFEPYCAYIFTSIACFLLMSIASAWHTWNILTATSSDALIWYVATYQAPLRNLQIHGFMVFMIFGISIKAFPLFFGLPDISIRRAWLVWKLFAVALATEICFFLLYRFMEIRYLASALLLPWILYCIGVAAILRVWRLSRSLKINCPANRFIIFSYWWLIISLILLVFIPLYQWISAISFSHAYYGAIRHAITVGFVSLFLMGAGIKLFSSSAMRVIIYNVAFLLINIGCFLRVTLQIVTDWNSAAFLLIGISGLFELTAFMLWGATLAVSIYQDQTKFPYFNAIFNEKPGVL